MSMSPCDLHEVTNCTYCTGNDKRFEESLVDPEPDASTPLPVIPGGPTIRARFAGNCKSCGRRYQVNEGIHHDRDADGWIGVECCA